MGGICGKCTGGCAGLRKKGTGNGERRRIDMDWAHRRTGRLENWRRGKFKRAAGRFSVMRGEWIYLKRRAGAAWDDSKRI